MKRIFIIPILIFSSFLISFYGVFPQALAQKEAKENYLKREQDVKNRQEYFNALKATLLEVFIYQEALDKIELSMPGDVSLASLIGFFDQKAQANGLTLKSVAPYQQVISPEGELKDIDKIPSQSFSVSLSGTVSSFESFLKDIGTSLRLVDVESFSFQQQQSEDEGSLEPSLGITVQVKVYY